MLLVADVGNTHSVLGLYEEADLVHDFRIESSPSRTRDEYHVLLRSLLDVAEVGRDEVEAAIIGSVVPAVTETFARAIALCFGFEPLVVGPGIKTGMPILYENPREVGADRIVNAVAAYELVHGPVVVVDFGTATTFDVISAAGEYLGGVIAPGIHVAADALFARAAKLPRVEVALPPRVVGKNTIHSMQSGIVLGYVGLVDGMVERIQDELGTEVSVIATGGLARVVQAESKTIERVEEYLTLEGLRLLYERNAA
ncbi:MAG TPA: type III pantothenate kinase [Sandaracinaceae bacterium LLY-WYZ-13_1]|nr:type III pantothenate kinase [Sandaracinaceae bacterium LLY-WYZ-13_1]